MASAKEYIETLAQAAGFDDTIKAGLLKAVENDKFAKGLEEGVMLRSDYSRQSDALKTEKQSTANYYQQLVTWKAEQDQLYAGLQQPTIQQSVNGEYLTKKDFEAMQAEYKKELDRREQVNISLLKDGMRLASQHAVEFHEPLDTEALAKIAVDKNMSLRQAYDEMVGGRRKEQADAAAKERDKRIADQAVREFASQHQIPVDSSPRESGYGRPSYDGQSKVVGDYDGAKQLGRLNNAQSSSLRQAFVEEWNKAEAGTSSST